MQEAYGKTWECCRWLPIELMPQNKDAFDLFQKTLPGTNWAKGADGLYRLQYKPSDVALIMQALEIKGRRIYEDALNCLSSIKQEHVG